MVSLRDKRTNHEFLFQQNTARYIRGQYGGPLFNEQAAGYDDMFPTISEIYYPEAPWKGIALPDHGEVWSLDWEIRRQQSALTLSVEGVRLPYRLTRQVSLPGPNQLRLDYTLENRSQFPIAYLWSAHPMLNVEEGCKVLLPEECHVATTGMSVSGRIGEWGHQFTWPVATASDGTKHDVSVIRSRNSKDATVYYFTDPLKHGWCALKYPSGPTLRFTFPPERIPYLGVIVGEGLADDPRYYALLEPCTAPFARPDLPYAKKSRVEARATERWFLTITIEQS
jgi:hypothetical protein